MLKWFLKRAKKDKKGFTLVELVVVIAILGVLAGIAVPKLGTSRKRAAITAHNANVRTLINAATMYIVDENVQEDTWEWTEDSDDWEYYLQEWPKVPNGLDVDEDENEYKVTTADGDIVVTPEAYHDENDN